EERDRDTLPVEERDRDTLPVEERDRDTLPVEERDRDTLPVPGEGELSGLHEQIRLIRSEKKQLQEKYDKLLKILAVTEEIGVSPVLHGVSGATSFTNSVMEVPKKMMTREATCFDSLANTFRSPATKQDHDNPSLNTGEEKDCVDAVVGAMGCDSNPSGATPSPKNLGERTCLNVVVNTVVDAATNAANAATNAATNAVTGAMGCGSNASDATPSSQNTDETGCFGVKTPTPEPTKETGEAKKAKEEVVIVLKINDKGEFEIMETPESKVGDAKFYRFDREGSLVDIREIGEKSNGGTVAAAG
ncbi:MAG: hypothetical protein KGP29_03080, partial [Proteobacteria bacterium]|nr:hypothetical protein [Pseudomonadota bacterium]